MERAASGGGQSFVAGEDLEPVLDRLVGGDQGGTPLVAVADQAKDETGLWPGEGLKAHLVDDEQRDAVVFLAAQALGRHLGVALEGGEQIVETEEGDGEAVFYRQELASTVCELLDWRRPGGGLKTWEARDLLAALEVRGLVSLPALHST